MSENSECGSNISHHSMSNISDQSMSHISHQSVSNISHQSGSNLSHQPKSNTSCSSNDSGESTPLPFINHVPRLTPYTVRCSFVQRLVDLARTKFESTLSILMDDSELFRHAINEVLVFEKTISETYPELDLHTCLSILSAPPTLNAWMTVDKAFVNERIDVLVALEDPWLPVVDEPGDGDSPHPDDLRPTRSADFVIDLADSITDRYRLLPDVRQRLRFAEEFQLKLLSDIYLTTLDDELRLCMSDLRKGDNSSNRWKFICARLNSAHYIRAVLGDWGERTLFLEMVRAKYEHEESCTMSEQVPIETDQSSQSHSPHARTLFEGVREKYE
eukprot:85435_1